MQFFFSNCTHILTRTQVKKFEDMFLIKIASIYILTILVVTITVSRKKSILTMFFRGSYFKGLDNKIICYVHIQ